MTSPDAIMIAGARQWEFRQRMLARSADFITTAAMLDTLTHQLNSRRPLSEADVAGAVAALVDEQVPADRKADFLIALAAKGETVDEIGAFATQLRERSVQPVLNAATRAGEILDVCGTGGDRLNTFNISTTVALVASAAGITVAKHGNRAITSQAGSADVLEALGVRIDLGAEEAGRWLAEHQFAFLFAPHYHPAFRHLGPARKLCAERGQRTIFNFLGPLLNPARPTAQLIGVPRPTLCQPLAHVLRSLGVRRGMVVCGSIPHLSMNPLSPSTVSSPTEATAPMDAIRATDQNQKSTPLWLDELSTLGPNMIAEFHHDRALSLSEWSPNDLPLQPAALSDLTGGNREANAAIVRQIITGVDCGPRRDAVLLNSAAALFLSGRASSLAEGWDQAARLIDTEAVQRKLEELVAASK
jgi:anthranilate phosphoribosyltransferase